MLKGWVALTGTPGVGKSTTADRLRLSGIPHVDLGRFAHDYDLVEGIDPKRMSAIVDPRRVGPKLAEVTQEEALLLLEGHWSHDVPGVRAAIVLRLRPSLLGARMAARGWPPAKVDENVEAEAMDLILQEAVHAVGRGHVFEVDTTGRGPDKVAATVYRILKGDAAARRRHAPGRIDWSEEILARYA